MGRIDIVIDKEIAIELKIAENRGNLDSLFAQLEWYKEIFDQICILILDLNMVDTIQEYKRRLEEKGANVVIIDKVRFSK